MRGTRARVLLVMHESSLQGLNRIVLESEGFEVIRLPPETDSLPFVRREHPDVLVVDVRPSRALPMASAARMQSRRFAASWQN